VTVSDSDDENVAVTAKADAAEITKAETTNAEASDKTQIKKTTRQDRGDDDDYEEFMYSREEIKQWVAKVKDMVEQEADRVTVPSLRAAGAVEASDKNMIKKTTRQDRGDDDDYEEFMYSRTEKALWVAKVRAGQIKKTASSAATVQVTKMDLWPTKTEFCTCGQPSAWTDELISAWIIEHSENDTKKEGKDTKKEEKDTSYTLGPFAANATSYLQPRDSNLHSQLKKHFMDETPIWHEKLTRKTSLYNVHKKAAQDAKRTLHPQWRVSWTPEAAPVITAEKDEETEKKAETDSD